jgi:hypothetical protein
MMNLSNEDAALFFRLMWQAQLYVNRRLDILPDIDSVEAYGKLTSQQKIQVRDALYKNIGLLDDFVAQNPVGLSEDELQIVKGWKRFVAGDFFVLRFLKRHAVFISSGKSSKVYGVLGLYDAIEDVLYGHPLPIWVGAVLLPFKGHILYDGLLTSRDIMFGSGIRGDLNETYQAAKQAGNIIESLEPGIQSAGKPKPKKPARDWSPVLDGLVETTEQLKQAENVFQTRAFSVLKASARLAQAAAHDPDKLDEIAQQAKSVQRALRQLETALGRAGWYE